MERRRCYDNWWFWLFVFLMFAVFCIAATITQVSSEAIEKGEYKIIVDVGDNYKNLIDGAKEIRCSEMSCPEIRCPILNYSVYNWNLTPGDADPYWIYVGALWRRSFR